MKRATLPDTVDAWRKLPWQLQTGCNVCHEQRLCHGRSRYKMVCVDCFIRLNLRKSELTKLIEAKVL